MTLSDSQGQELANSLGLPGADAARAIARFKVRSTLRIRARSSLEDFLPAYAAGLREARGVDNAADQSQLFAESIPDAWRLTLDGVGATPNARALVVGAFRARARTGGRIRASFNDFAGAYLLGLADGSSGGTTNAQPGPAPAITAEAELSRDEPVREAQPVRLSAMWASVLPEAYARWNVALAEEFFRPELANRPAYLAVDGERLAEIAEQRGWNVKTAEADFVASVRSVIQTGSLDYAKPFRYLNFDARSHDIPSFIGVLGLSVLAASQMAGDPEMRASNYFGRCADLIASAQYGRKGFEHVIKAWDKLNEWLDRTHHGQLGRATARPLGRLNWIGYPISQCLLRDQDRRRLPGFFRWASLLPGDDPSPLSLVPLLTEWAATSSAHLSSFGRRTIQDPGSQGLLADVVADELHQWNGELETEASDTRHRTARLWVGLEDHGGRHVSLYLIPQRPLGFPPELELESRSGGRISLRIVDEDDPWYEPVHMPDPQFGLGKTEWVTLDGRYSERFEPADVVPLVLDEELGLWRQAPRLRFDEEALVLSSPGFAPKVEELLQKRSLQGWARHTLPGLPTGWIAYTDVRMIEAGETAELELRCLSPLAAVGISLAGGLALGRRIWLSEGEPTVHVRTTRGATPVPLFLDGKLVATLGAEGGTFDLASCKIEPGEHLVQAGEQQVTFSTRPGSDSPGWRPGCQSIAIPLRRDGQMFTPAVYESKDVWTAGPLGVVRIRGAEILALAGDEPVGCGSK